MSKMTGNFEPELFVGRTVEMVSFAAYGVSVHFSAGLSLQIESEYFYRAGGCETSRATPPEGRTRLPLLVGATVITANTERDRSLCLTFGGSGWLRCSTSLSPHECYRIWSKELGIDVWVS